MSYWGEEPREPRARRRGSSGWSERPRRSEPDDDEPWWRTDPPPSRYDDRYDDWETGSQRQADSTSYADDVARGRHRTGRYGYDPDAGRPEPQTTSYWPEAQPDGSWAEPQPNSYWPDPEPAGSWADPEPAAWSATRPARRTSREPRGRAPARPARPSGPAEPAGWSSVEPNGWSEPQPSEPDLGSWSRSRGRWVPGTRDADRPDYTISRYDDTGEMPRSLLRNGSGPVIDHDDWREKTGTQSRVETPDTEDGWSRREWERRVEPTRSVEPVGRTEPPRRSPSTRRSETRSQRRLEPARRVEPYRQAVRATVPVRRAEPVRDRRAIAATAYAAPYSAPPAHLYTTSVEESDQRRSYLGAALATVGWYAVPTLLYLVWALLLSGRPRPNCLDALGNPCLSARDQALHNLMQALPRVGAAVGLAVVVAMVVRYVSTGWRGLTVGFAAAIVGAGVTTVMFSVLGR